MHLASMRDAATVARQRGISVWTKCLTVNKEKDGYDKNKTSSKHYQTPSSSKSDDQSVRF